MPNSPYFGSYQGSGSLLPAGYAQLLAKPGEYWANAIDKIGDDVADAIKQGKLSKSLGQTIDSYADTLPKDQGDMLKAKNATWGAAQRQGYIQSLSLQNVMRQSQQQQALNDEKLAGMQQDRAAAQNFRDSMNDYSSRATPLAAAFRTQAPVLRTLGFPAAADQAGALPQNPSPDAQGVLQMAMRSGMDPRDAMSLARGQADISSIMQENGNLTSDFVQDPITGSRFLTRGRTTLPSGADPTVANGNLPTVKGYTTVPNGRGGFTLVPESRGNVTDEDVYKNLISRRKELSANQASARAMADPASVIALQSKIDAIDAKINSYNSGSSGAAQPSATVDSFDSEDAARAAGKKNGDIVFLKGIGKVRLK